MSGGRANHARGFSLLETVFMILTLGIFVWLLAGVTRPLWWDHVKDIFGKEAAPAAAAEPAKK